MVHAVGRDRQRVLSQRRALRLQRRLALWRRQPRSTCWEPPNSCRRCRATWCRGSSRVVLGHGLGLSCAHGHPTTSTASSTSSRSRATRRQHLRDERALLLLQPLNLLLLAHKQHAVLHELPLFRCELLQHGLLACVCTSESRGHGRLGRCAAFGR